MENFSGNVYAFVRMVLIALHGGIVCVTVTQEVRLIYESHILAYLERIATDVANLRRDLDTDRRDANAANQLAISQLAKLPPAQAGAGFASRRAPMPS